MLATSSFALFLLPLIIQVCSYALTRTGFERQRVCQQVGIGYLTLGILFLVFRNAVFSFIGLLLLMLGLFLVAKGLDRKDKKIFIDRYRE